MYQPMDVSGNSSLKNQECLLSEEMQSLYKSLLTSTASVDVRTKVQVIHNIETFLQEEETSMLRSYDECEWKGVG